MSKQRRLIFATAFNEGYLPSAFPYLLDIDQRSELENICLGIDFMPQVPFHNFTYTEIDSSKLRLPLNNWCIQHGEFIDYIDCKPRDVILFTDADIRMQRAFNQQELETLRSLGPEDVFVGFNAGPHDTLLDEAQRLRPLVPIPQLVDTFGTLRTPCFNVGVVAARRCVWEKLCDEYCRMYPRVEKMFGHVARQQWLISWLMHNLFTPVYMPQSFHSHGHYSMPRGCYYDEEGKLLYNGELVLLRHKL